MRPPNPFRISDNRVLEYLGLTVRLGLTISVSIVGCFFLALLLERRFETGGLLLAGGVVLGVLIGGWAAYRMTLSRLAHPDEKLDEKTQ